MFDHIFNRNIIFSILSKNNDNLNAIEKIFNETLYIHKYAEIQTIESIVILIIFSTMIYTFSQKIKLPYTLTLMISGLLMSFFGWIPKIELTHDLLVVIFLPALLFEAAIHFSARELKQYATTITVLAAPVVFLTALTTAIVLNIEITTLGIYNKLSFLYLLLFGTLISATDPISVITLFKQLGVNKRLLIIIEGESLFNDGTAIVFFIVTLQIIKSGQLNIYKSLLKLFTVVFGGMITGSIIGIISNLFITIFRKDKIICIAITIATTYGSYILAEKINGSGILAAVISGLFVGNLNKKEKMNIDTKIAIASFWEYIVFFIISIIFLMMGLEVNIKTLINSISIIIISFITVIISRAMTLIISLPLLKKIGQPIDIKSAIVILWGGLRGALSMVLVLSLDETITNRNILITMTFGVVLLSVFIQGSTMEFLLKKLNFISSKSNLIFIINKQIIKLYLIKKQKKEIKKMINQDKIISKGLLIKLKKEKNKIIKNLKNFKKDPGYIKAVAERINIIEDYLSKITINSYNNLLKKGLISKEEINDISNEYDK